MICAYRTTLTLLSNQHKHLRLAAPPSRLLTPLFQSLSTHTKTKGRLSVQYSPLSLHHLSSSVSSTPACFITTSVSKDIPSSTDIPPVILKTSKNLKATKSPKLRNKSKSQDRKPTVAIVIVKSKDKRKKPHGNTIAQAESASTKGTKTKPRLVKQLIDSDKHLADTSSQHISSRAHKRPMSMPAPTPAQLKKASKRRIQPLIGHKQRTGLSRVEPAARVQSPAHVHEELTESVKILCEAMEEAHVRRVHQLPPVFLASNYEQAEIAMQLFEEYYQTIRGFPGPVGFDTETTSNFFQHYHPSASLIQIATQDVCLLFQIHRIVQETKGRPVSFPPRLKRFLEDPKQSLVGVAAANDAKELGQAYGVKCGGIISLEKLAKENNILAASLADLDAMFGRPGREVIKTKKMLSWNWDLPDLDPTWIWYAAKDAFAGVAIYENMLSNTLKEGYRPYEQQFPMTESETASDIFSFLLRSVGKGKLLTLSSLENAVSKSYSRFHKIYQPSERPTQVKKYVKMLLDDGRVVSHETDPQLELTKNSMVSLAGRSISSMLQTRDGVKIVSKYFKDNEVDVSTLASTGITLPNEGEDEEAADMRLFLELGSTWDQPRKLATLVSVYAHEKAAAENRKIHLDALLEQGQTMEDAAGEDVVKIDRATLPKSKLDRVKATEVIMPFLKKLKRRGLLQQDGPLWALNPDVERLCLEVVPPSSPVELRTASTVADFTVPAALFNESVDTSDKTPTVLSEVDVSLEITDDSAAGTGRVTVITPQQTKETKGADIPEKKPRLS
ncbi:hypothetical protein BGX28_005902 [Mortierella sp. GBA30]|nr:hypothetical protein BGX28_005902 [Mortierella sp. GBA30]